MKYWVICRWPKASYSVSSITCGCTPKRAAWSRSMVSVAVIPPICWSVATSRSIGSDFSLSSIVRRPGVQLAQVGVLQRVLELGLGDAAADADVLRGLQEQRAALTFCSFGRMRADEVLRRAGDPLVPRLQRDEHAAVVGGLAADAGADRRGIGRHVGILRHDLVQLLPGCASSP